MPPSFDCGGKRAESVAGGLPQEESKVEVRPESSRASHERVVRFELEGHLLVLPLTFSLEICRKKMERS